MFFSFSVSKDDAEFTNFPMRISNEKQPICTYRLQPSSALNRFSYAIERRSQSDIIYSIFILQIKYINVNVHALDL